MSMGTILDGLTLEIQRREAAKLGSFGDLAEALAAGETVEPSKALKVLEACGKTPQDLANAASRLQRRRSLRSILDDRKAREREMNAADWTIERLEEELRVTAEAMRGKIEVARQKRAECAVRVGECAEAERELIASADPAIRERLRDLEETRQSYAAQDGEVSAVVSRLRVKLSAMETTPARAYDVLMHLSERERVLVGRSAERTAECLSRAQQEREDRLGRLRSEIARQESRLAPIESRLAEVCQEEAELRPRLLEP